MTTDTLEEFAENKICFVTYNYDRFLEHFLFTALRNTYGEKDEKCAAVAKKIGIIHLHGQVAQLPWQDQKRGIPFGFEQLNPAILDIAMQRIKIVHEDTTDRDNDFNIARRMLFEAKRIYFMGFSYGTKNIERLMFDRVPSKSNGTALGMKQMEKDAAYTQLERRIELIETDCLSFLRENAPLD
jgi:SIR2-like domain